MKNYQHWLMALFTGVLLSLAWPAHGFPFIALVAFIPLFFVENDISSKSNSRKGRKVFLLSFFAFLVWNALTTWWIYYATLPGMLMAVVFNSIFMALVFLFFHLCKRNIYANKRGWFLLPMFWIAFEYAHMNWDLSWSWLNLGNAFANYPSMIQWYDITGTLGGTFWIFACNIILFRVLKYKFAYTGNSKHKIIKHSLIFAAVLLIPLVYSIIKYHTYHDKGKEISIVIVQPNIDPYNEKFGGISVEEQLNKMLGLAKPLIDSNTQYLILPETAITSDIDENDFNNDEHIQFLKGFIAAYPNLKMIIGASTYKIYQPYEKKSYTARPMRRNPEYYYDAYNTALQIDNAQAVQAYHKSKLVPGVEQLPFPAITNALAELAFNLGGTTGSLGVQDSRDVFFDHSKTLNAAPVVCYESIYGDYVAEYIRNGANFIAIITNDGWWENTAGHRQHCRYASLRAIETRRSIARSANTGISCFVNQRGDISQPTKWWTPDAIKGSIFLNNKKTFYTRYGDYFGRISALATLLMVLLSISLYFMKRKQKG